jgi:putative spermidine/putrescine transport system permease protein
MQGEGTTTPAGQTRSAATNGLGRRVMDWLPAAPLLLVAVSMLLLPVGALVAQSFQHDDGGLTLEHWARVLGGRSGQQAIGNSLLLGALSATISLAVGGPVAWLVSRMLPVGRATWLAILNVAANFGGIGLAFGYVATLGTLGMLTLALKQLGLAFTPPSSGSFVALLIAYQYTNIPLFVLLTLPAMGVVKPEWWEAAQTASATRWQFWSRIGLPVLAPFLGAGWLLIFTWSVGLYGLPFALGAGVAGAGTRLITTAIGDALLGSLFGQQRVAVLGAILLLIATVTLTSYRLLLRRAMRWL